MLQKLIGIYIEYLSSRISLCVYHVGLPHDKNNYDTIKIDLKSTDVIIPSVIEMLNNVTIYLLRN